jgi:two-component system chemotaxis sensor kinase CheA
MDMSQYRDLFITEAREYLRNIGGMIVTLEKDAGDRETIDALFRAAHSIKGMAASMEFGDIAELAHKLEDLMSRVRKETLAFDSGVADLLLEGADVIEAMIADLESGTHTSRDLAGLLSRIVGYEPTDTAGGSDLADLPPACPEPAPPGESTPSFRRGRDKGGAQSTPTVRVKTGVLDHLINITGELITTKHRLVNIAGEVPSVRLIEAVAELSRLLGGLHREVMQVRLMPLATITDRFPRLVRDLARNNGKEADFSIEGKEIELDRGILEELSDPLLHILRNAVDHGLEPVEARMAAGKPKKGTISLQARRERDQVILTIADDGRGMDSRKLVASAIERGFITPEAGAHLSLPEAYLLTCLPGFSTADTVTEISGRGVGMDAVKATVHSLCGTMAIESELGAGTRIILKLPLTAAIINVLLMDAGPFTVAVPVMNVIRTMELPRELIREENGRELFQLDGEQIPLLSLNRIFGVPVSHLRRPSLPIFICEIRGCKMGLAVDGFIGHQEVFVKPLGRPLDKLKGVAGGVILGDGKVIFIIDVANLL